MVVINRVHVIYHLSHLYFWYTKRNLFFNQKINENPCTVVT